MFKIRYILLITLILLNSGCGIFYDEPNYVPENSVRSFLK